MNARRTGFTLIELMVTVALISIMLAIAVPSFASFISSYRATAAINEVLQALTLARSEALKRGRSVTVLPNASDGTPSATGSWANGWTVFVDANNSLTYVPATHTPPLPSEDALIFTHPALPASMTVTGAGASTVPFNGLNYVIFDGQGYPRTSSGGLISSSGSGIVLSNGSGSTLNQRTLCVAIMGRPRIVNGPPDPCTTG